MAVCVAALAYVLNGVSVHDHVTLKDGQSRRVLEINHDNQTITIGEPDDRQETLPLDLVATGEDGKPQITHGLLTAWRQSHKSFLLLTLAMFAPVTFLQSVRFLLVFRAQDIALSYWECVKLCFAGNFLNWATPIGSTAGDVFKAYHVARHTERKTEALTTILLDRIIGLGVLLLCVGIAIELGAEDPLLRNLGHVIMAGIAGAAIVAGLFCSDRVRERWLPRGLMSRLPFEEHIRRVDAATRRLLRHLPTLGGAVICSLVLQFFALSSFVLAAYALRMNFAESKVFDYYACIGSGVVVAAIPISPQGLGTSEAVYRKFMLGSHGTLSQLLYMAMAVRLIQLCWSLLGALVALTGSYKLKPAVKTDQIE
ncbi:MAG: flippase-like domain-containing protein [Phycisphaerae bacterium]|nr:flippase-like domain-containing protein [Phycisphaerae bacterium]